MLNLLKIRVLTSLIFIFFPLFLKAQVFAESISIENLIRTASRYFGTYVSIEGYAACPECFQIESGGCSGVLCTGNLAIQETSTGGPSIILAGSYNGNRIGCESDGCVLMSTPLHIGWKYRIWGRFRPFASTTEAVNYTIVIDSFVVVDKNPDTFDPAHGTFFEGTGSDRIAYLFDSTGKGGVWLHLKSFAPRQNSYDGFDTTERGTFRGELVDNAWNGPWSSYFYNGKIYSRGTFFAGAKHGAWVQSDSSGKILAQGSFNKGREYGLWKKTLRSNEPPAIFDYQTHSGKIVITEYSADSVIDADVVIDRDFLTIEKIETFYPDGKKRRLVTSDPASGKAYIEERLDNGKTVCKQAFADGVFTDSLWFPNGKMWKVKKKDVAGRINDFSEWHENGVLARQGKFRGFAPHGSWISIDTQGRREASVDFVDGVPVGTAFSDKDSSFEWTAFTGADCVNTLMATRDGIISGTDGGACFFSKSGAFVGKKTTADGLPGNKVKAVAVDSAGTIWFGGGHDAMSEAVDNNACCISFVGQPLAKLTVQNGYLGNVIVSNGDTAKKYQCNTSNFLLGAFTRSGKWNYYEQVNNDQNVTGISHISISADNAVWYSSLNGIRRINPGLSEELLNRMGAFSSRIEAQKDSSVWLLGLDSIYRLKGDSVVAYRLDNSASAGELIALKSGIGNNIYLLAEKGIFLFAGSDFTKIISLDSKCTPVHPNFYPCSDGSFLIAINSGIARITKNGPRIIVDKALLGNVGITSFIKDSSILWIGTKNGLYRFGHDGIKLCTVPGGPRGEHAELVRTGLDNCLWVYEKGTGVYRYDGKIWKLFDFYGKIPGRDILDILPDRSGGLWIGTDNGIVHLSNSFGIDTVFAGCMAHGTVSNLAYNRRGVLFYVKDQSIVASFDNHESGAVYDQPVLVDGPIRSMAIDTSGALWISNNRGIVYVDKKNVAVTYTSANGLPALPITRLFVDDKNTVYAVSLQAVYRFDNVKWQSVFVEDNINGSIVSGIAEDARSGLWVGTKSGLVRFAGSRPEMFTQSNGVIGNKVNDIAANDRGDVWIATEQGICRYSRKVAVKNLHQKN